jgi:hypothetical protein
MIAKALLRTARKSWPPNRGWTGGFLRSLAPRPAAFALLVALTSASAGQAQDAAEIIRKAVDQYSRNEETLKNYTYKALTVVRDLDGKGKVKATHKTLAEIMYIDGRRWTRTLAVDDKPLPEAEQKRGQKEENIRQRASNNPMKYVPLAYDLKIVGQPDVNGRSTWQIRATPKNDYKGPHANVFRHVEGTLWVDKQDGAWVRFEADTNDTISFGWFVARVAKGTRISVERMRVNDEVWAPRVLSLKGSARIALVKAMNEEQESTYSDYKKYRTDGRIVESGEAPE